MIDRAGDIAHAIVDERQQVAEVLMLTDWHVALPEVVKTVPGAFEEILDELERVYSADVALEPGSG